jgi:hypothetical protein
VHRRSFEPRGAGTSTPSLSLTSRTAPTRTTRAGKPPKTCLTSGRRPRPPCSQPTHTHTKVHCHIRLKCIQTLKVRVRIMYAELLDPSPGGPVGVGEGHVREPSKKVSVPCCGDVDRPHRLASTRQSSQHHGVIQTERHLAGEEVERVCLWSPPVHKRSDQWGVVAEPCQLLRPGNLSS